MKRVFFCVGLIGGYVLGARAGHRRYVELKQLGEQALASPIAEQALTYAQRGVDEATDAAASLRANAPRYLAEAGETIERITAPAVERVRGSLYEAGESAKRFGQAVGETGREFPDRIVEGTLQLKSQLQESSARNRERQVEDVFAVAEMRDAGLADLAESPSDSMFGPEAKKES